MLGLLYRMSSHRSLISSTFKLHGFSLKLDALRYLSEILAPFDISTVPGWLDKILDALQRQSLDTAAIELKVVQAAVKECTYQDESSPETFNVISAFACPKFVHDAEKKKFIQLDASTHATVLFGSADDKALLYRERYNLIHQRLLRHPSFLSSTLDRFSSVSKANVQLRTVEALVNSSCADQTTVVLGILTQLKHDRFYLEDPSGCVEVDLTNTAFHLGIFTENSIVLAEGRYDDGVFRVSGLAQPPAETADKSRAYFGNVNFFGGSSKTCAKASQKLARLEMQNESAVLVFASDVHIDKASVLSNLERLFQDAEEAPPIAIVLCGNFCSQPFGKSHFEKLRDSFKKLADIMGKFPQLCQETHFVFVPGLRDPTIGNILPRPALPEHIVQPLRGTLSKCHFATNPCRIQYCTQEIVIFREDIVHKMCRNAVSMPSAEKDISRQFVKSLLSQGHLSPLPLHVSPVYWALDHSLRIYPLPDLVVVADKYDPYTEVEMGCTVTNPGSFDRTPAKFRTYCPMTRAVEEHDCS